MMKTIMMTMKMMKMIKIMMMMNNNKSNQRKVLRPLLKVLPSQLVKTLLQRKPLAKKVVQANLKLKLLVNHQRKLYQPKKGKKNNFDCRKYLKLSKLLN